jgi:Ca-activated chloride channel family protein
MRAAGPPPAPMQLGWDGKPVAGGMPATEIPRPNVPTEAAIDPNGRFATTYRPGGGHLAAFESAVARGIIPAAEREVVSDVGARYAPAMDPPKSTALALRTDLERAKIAPGGGATHVRVALRSTQTAPAGRPHLSVHLVLDISGSMAGEPIVQAREAARALVKKLDAADDFSLVTFSSDAEVRVEDGPVGARRAQILKTIDGIVQGGGTNIGRGLTLGYQQAGKASIPADAVKVVLLLSDGRANAGITSGERLARMALDAFQSGIQTSSFGLGADYDGALMSSIASDGAGGYYYLRDPDQISAALATELDKRLDPVATAVEVRIRLKPDVKLYQVYGSRRLSEAEAARVRAVEVAADQQAQKRDGIKKDREDDAKGGMRFFIPAFARDDSHALLLKLGVPAGVGSRDAVLSELKYKDRVAKKNVVEEIPIKVTFANSDAESAASADPSVSRTVQGFAAGESLAEAARQSALGDRGRAVAILSEREGILRTAADTLQEPLFLKDADRLARLRGHAGSNAGLGDPLVLAMLLETASRTHLH